MVDLDHGGVTFGMRRHQAGEIDIPPLLLIGKTLMICKRFKVHGIYYD